MEAERDAGVIAVEGRARGEIAASGARLQVQLEGDSYLYGNEALSKAKELNALVERLSAAGVPERQIEVAGVELTAKSGLLSSASSAKYTLAVTVERLATLSAVLGALSAAKTLSLGEIEWRYDGEPALRASLLGAATREALQNATAMAEALGVRLGAPRRVSDQTARPRERQYEPAPSAVPPMRRRAGEPLELGTTVGHTRVIEVRVSAEFWLEGPA